MSYLFDHKFKNPSSWVFYLTIPVALYFLFTDQFDNIMKIQVFSLFPSDILVSTTETESIIDNRGFIWIENGILDEILTIVIIVSGILSSFSKEKVEDEMISSIRMKSLVLSLYINYGMLILSNLFIYEMAYFYAMVIHLFTILLFFNLIFNFRLYKHYNS
ncbi:MAG: hypothetical protein WBV45_01030 [Lutimonas sp.]